MEKNTRREETVWRKPAIGCLKVNCVVHGDREETMIGGTGWVIRNSAGCGWFQMGGGRGGVRAASCLAIEAVAVKQVREALWACVEKGYQQIIVESDSFNLISMLNGKEVYDAAIESLIFDIRELVKQLSAVEYAFVTRNCNKAAHLMASYTNTKGTRILS